MTKVFFVRHAEPNYDNHDDRSRELSPRGMEDRYNRSPGGESYQMVMERLFNALDYILGQHDASSDKNLLIISHGAVIMTLLAMKSIIKNRRIIDD